MINRPQATIAALVDVLLLTACGAAHGDGAACRAAFTPTKNLLIAVNAVNNSTATTNDEVGTVTTARDALLNASNRATSGSPVQLGLSTFGTDVAKMRVAWLGGNGFDGPAYVKDGTALASACRAVDSEW